MFEPLCKHIKDTCRFALAQTLALALTPRESDPEDWDKSLGICIPLLLKEPTDDYLQDKQLIRWWQLDNGATPR